MYVDDFLGDIDSIDSDRAFIDDLQLLFKSGSIVSFQLRKWYSNELFAMEHLPNSLKTDILMYSLNPDLFQRIPYCNH